MYDTKDYLVLDTVTVVCTDSCLEVAPTLFNRQEKLFSLSLFPHKYATQVDRRYVGDDGCSCQNKSQHRIVISMGARCARL